MSPFRLSAGGADLAAEAGNRLGGAALLEVVLARREDEGSLAPVDAPGLRERPAVCAGLDVEGGYAVEAWRC